MVSLIGGFVGSLIAIYTIRHKNKKAGFMFPFAVAATISLTIIYVLVAKTNILM